MGLTAVSFGEIGRLARFVLVGIVTAAAYTAALALAMEILHADLLWAAVAAFAVGTVTSYVGNSLLTFRTRMTRANARRFLAVVLAGLGLNQLIAWTVETAGLNYLFLPLAVFVVVPAFNYIGHRLYSFGGELSGS